MNQFLDILKLLDRKEKRQLVLILLSMIPNALMQVAGIASIMPFISVLAQPSLIDDNRIFANIYQFFEFTSTNQFLMVLAAAALIILFLSNALAALTTWLIVKFTYLRIHTFSNRLLFLYLHQEYEFFLARNPSELTKNVITEINNLVSGYLMPLLQLAARVAVLLAIVLFLIAMDPILALVVGALLGGSYILVYFFFRKILIALGERRFEANRRRFKSTHEAFGAIKDLKVLGRTNFYIYAYREASHQFAVNQANYSLITQIPRYMLEIVAFGMILIISLYLVAFGQSMQNALPIIALYAMAGYRLMPLLQQVYDHVVTLRFATPVVHRMIEEMRAAPPLALAHDASPGTPLAKNTGSPLSLKTSLELINICYRYPNMEETTLQDISLTIPARTTAAFIGESGAGKSTIVDIILGLLKPTAGSILVDQTVLTQQNLHAWQKNIGYVPQAIYLSDDTIRHNIALGIPDHLIDDQAVERAARAASIHEFIVADLPDGYDTIAGDRGVRLSGGQRQRIGIARALYHNPDVLILDEATSALDGTTEAAVMDAMHSLSGQKTIIMIAHRLTTVQDCDKLFLFKRGALIASGSFQHIMEINPEFRRMASISSEPKSVERNPS